MQPEAVVGKSNKALTKGMKEREPRGNRMIALAMVKLKCLKTFWRRSSRLVTTKIASKKLKRIPRKDKI